MTIDDEKVVASAATAPPSAPVGMECPQCGSESLSWEPFYTNKSGVPDGRLRVHDVGCVFALGCNECSETVRVVDADAAAIALAQQPAAVDGACAAAAIRFALTDPEGMTFLRLWNEGDFDTLRREWPDAPIEVYVGADPLAAQPGGAG